jgi:hypothetical protein
MGEKRMTLRSVRLTLALAAVCLASSSALRAQAVLPEHGRDGGLKTNVFGLGFAAGPVSGIGLSFRHHLPGSISYAIAGGIIKVDNTTAYAFGIEGQYDLVRNSTNRFYAAAGTGYYHSGNGSHNDLSGPWRLGLGIGEELAIVSSGFHVNAELLFSYFNDGTVLPLPQIGVHYYFY